MKNYWTCLYQWMETQDADIKGTLNKGAKPAELKELEDALGAKLPKELKDFYKIHNGQTDGIFNNQALVQYDDESSWFFLSTSNAISELKVWRDLIADGEFADYTSSPTHAGIKDNWYNPMWIPFCGNGCGDFLCFDLDPVKGGKKGQIIEVWHDMPERNLLANSFAEWLDAYVCEKDGGAPVFIGEKSPMADLLNKILDKRKEKTISKSVKYILKNPSLKSAETLYEVNRLCIWLYILDETDLALELISFINVLPQDVEVIIREALNTNMSIEAFLLRDANPARAEECGANVLAWLQASDAKFEKSFNRRMNGSLLNDDRVASAIEDKNIESELYWRQSNVSEYFYIYMFNRSETYPRQKLLELIASEKEIIQSKIL